MCSSYYGTTNLFAEQYLSDFLDQKKLKVLSNIGSENDDYLLNVNENDYISFKLSKAIVEGLNIHTDKVYVSSTEQMISADRFPRTFHVHQGKSYKKDVIKFHVPFTGNRELLRCIPNPTISWSMKVEVRDNEFCFEIINFSDDAEKIVRYKDSNLGSIMRQLDNASSEVDKYNSGLETQIKAAFESRKSRILAKSGLLASLGVPIKKASNSSTTFSVPSPPKRNKIILNKPSVNEAGFTPEPCLDDTVYKEILQMIHDVGKEFERLPSLYAEKEEEHLRDHFLMMLEPNFEGSATGETFNKTGKTDILLRYNGSNIFIAECKFWRGQKSFLDTISQLMGYLTWRDSKASVIMFVRNKEFSSVIETAKTCINQHPNFLKKIDEKDETWLNYEFHLNDDRNRIVKVAVMLYHLPVHT